MIRVNASELTIGMTIARPVHDMQGVLLLKGGTIVTAKNIQVLKAWGVSRVWIEGEAREGEGEESVAAVWVFTKLGDSFLGGVWGCSLLHSL